MNKRGTGAIFCIIAALLFMSRYIAAAIWISGLDYWSSDMFSSSLSYVGIMPLILSVLSLIAGIYYLVRAELEDKK